MLRDDYSLEPPSCSQCYEAEAYSRQDIQIETLSNGEGSEREEERSTSTCVVKCLDAFQGAELRINKLVQLTTGTAITNASSLSAIESARDLSEKGSAFLSLSTQVCEYPVMSVSHVPCLKIL